MEAVMPKKLKIAVIFLILYDSSCQGEGRCPTGFYEHWKLEDNDFICCRAVFVEQGYEGIPCQLNLTEDTVRKCPPDKVQPDKNFSNVTLECTVEPDCSEDATKKLICDGSYCWNICVCDLERGRCGTQFLNCKDIREINCSGKIEEDCSCSPHDTTITTSQSTLLSSVLTKTYAPAIQTNISGTTPLVGKTRNTEYRNKTDKSTEDTGSTVSQVIIIGGAVLAVVIAVTSVMYAKKHEKEYEHRGLVILNRAAESKDQPLLNDGNIHIQMGNLNNSHKEAMPGGKQELDLDDQDAHQPLHNHNGNIYLQVEGLNVDSTPVPVGQQGSDPDASIPESHGELVEKESSETSVPAKRVACIYPIVRQPQNIPSSNQTMPENPVAHNVAASSYDTEYIPPIFLSLGPALTTDSLQSNGPDQVPREANTGSHSRETLSQN